MMTAVAQWEKHSVEVCTECFYMANQLQIRESRRGGVSSNHKACFIGLITLKNLDEVDIHCPRFCYTNLLRSNLQVISQLWNTHHLRKSRNRDSPHAKPEVSYHFPEANGRSRRSTVAKENC